MKLTRDETWRAFPDAKTFALFQEKILQPMYLKDAVPHAVKDAMEVVEKLALHSYYEYRFTDVALTQAIFALEKCMKIRYKEVNGTDWDSNFFRLIDWFVEHGFFETWNSDVPHTLRDIRNRKVHETQRTLGGIFFMQRVYNTIDLINDLYEDVPLRAARKESTTKLWDGLVQLCTNGGVFEWRGKKIICYRVFPVFIDNKADPAELYLSVCPIFKITRDEMGGVVLPNHIQLRVQEWNLENGQFTAIDCETGSQVVLHSMDAANEQKFSQWINEFRSLQEWMILDYTLTEPTGALFAYCLRMFHRKPAMLS